MASRYTYVGHEAIGAYVRRQLNGCGCEYVDDVAYADIVFTYCVSATALEDAYFDEKGLVKCAKAHTLFIDLSPSTPSLVRELAAVAAVNDQRFAEAPVSILNPALPDAFANPDNLACFLACEDDVRDEAVALLETLVGEVRFTGSSGSAQLAKALHTVHQAAQLCAAVESDALSRLTMGAGMCQNAPDPAIGAAPDTIVNAMSAVVDNRFSGSYTVEMLMGEVVAAMTAADDVELILPQLEAVMHLLEVLAVIGGADMSPAALSLLYREEKESAEQGLDWTRAEGLFSDHAHTHDYDGDEGFDDLNGFDDGLPFGNGFGGFSAN